jgi:hypothetical protein
MTVQIKNKPEHLTQTYNFKHVINHVDITQAEAEFVEKYGHLLDNNNLITRTLIDYETKTITIEAYSTSLFHPRKDNKGFIFDLNVAPHTNYKDLLKVFEPLGLELHEYVTYPSNHFVITSNKLTKEIIESAKEVIELENRTNTFTKTYHFDKRPTIQNLLDSQLKFLIDNKLHEDDITYVGINTDEKYLYNYVNTITITGRQSAKHKTYTDDIAAIIKSCIIVDRFDSCRHSAINTGGYDKLIERIISYQYPVVNDDTLELLESSVNITQVLEDISNKDGDIESTSSINEEDIADFATETLPEPEPKYPIVETGDKIYDKELSTSFEMHEVILNKSKVNEEDIAEFITDIPNNVDELIAETKAYHELQIRKDKSYYPHKDLVFTEDEIQKLKDFLKSL